MSDVRKGLPSASKWGSYEKCLGRYQLEQEAERLGQMPPSSVDATSGTAIHARLNGENVTLTETETTSAELLKERGQEQIERIFQQTEPEIVRETRLWMEIDGKPVLSGQFDLLAFYPKATPRLALVQDYKTGFSEPDPAEDNGQLRILALLVALHMPTLEEVVVQLVSGPYGVTEARYSIGQLSSIYDETIKLLRAITMPDAPLTPGPEQCKHCQAVMICQAVRDLVVRPLVKLQTSALPKEPDRAAKILDEMEVMAVFLKKTKAWYAEILSKDPTYSIPGWALVPGNVLREVTDWEIARARLGEFIDLKDLNSAADYRLGELEKALGKKLKLKGAPLRARMNEILKGLYVENQNASSLKRVKGK